jgi:NADPH:quinone reductase-like Zn-dependent oxidoreductase
MRAVIMEAHGGPDVLRLVELPQPKLAAGQALVRVKACGLNLGLDARTRENGAGRKLRFPHILGTEVVGEVVSGSSGAKFGNGQPVLVVPWLTCGTCPDCRAGRENACPSKQMVGIDVPGGYAEFIAVDERNLIALPKTAQMEQVAALPISFTTAWHMLARAAVAPAEVVLVLGAAGAVGLAAVQLAKHLGARVLAAASSTRKLDIAKEFGADELIDYSGLNFADEALRRTGGRGADVVVDHIGADTWADSIRSLAPNGRLIMCGATTGHALQLDARYMWRRNLSLLFSNSGTTSDLRKVIELWEQGRIRPLVARMFPLEEAASAHRMLAERSTIGKVVLTVS